MANSRIKNKIVRVLADLGPVPASRICDELLSSGYKNFTKPQVRSVLNGMVGSGRVVIVGRTMKASESYGGPLEVRVYGLPVHAEETT